MGAVVAAGLVAARADPSAFVIFLANAGVGSLLVVLRPRNAVGWLLVWTAGAWSA